MALIVCCCLNRPMRLSMALFAFAKMNLVPRPSFAQCMVRETERRLDQFDARVCLFRLP